MRKLIDKIQENNHVQGSNAGWCFVDAVTAGRFFRIDRAQENLHYVLGMISHKKSLITIFGHKQ